MCVVPEETTIYGQRRVGEALVSVKGDFCDNAI
jgi:hypothetical protein